MENATAKAARIWGSGDYDRIALTLAPMHDRLVGRLRPQAGQLWLDAATGTGEVAVRAARADAGVVGVDLARALLLKAYNRSSGTDLRLAFATADVGKLPFRDEAFDVVASAVGVVFAPNHMQAAQELARVCRRGGRLGLTAWSPDGGVGDFFRLMQPFEPASSGGSTHLDWGRPEHVRDLLGDVFDLDFDTANAPYRSASGESAWEELSQAYGPMRDLTQSLPVWRGQELRQAVVDFFERWRDSGHVQHSRQYLLVTGVKH